MGGENTNHLFTEARIPLGGPSGSLLHLQWKVRADLSEHRTLSPSYRDSVVSAAWLLPGEARYDVLQEGKGRSEFSELG